jgi:hypothetical protein
MANTKSSQSFYESVTGHPVNPLWVLRGFGIAAIVPLVLALFVFKVPSARDFCVGLSLGLLVGLIAHTFAISSFEINQKNQPSDVDALSITR